MSMTAAWAMPNRELPLTPGRRKDDDLEDKLILHILAQNAAAARSKRLSRSASALSLPSSGAGATEVSAKSSASSLTRTVTRTESKSALARASSTSDLGVPCYPLKSPYRREMQARTKSWRAGTRTGMLRVEVRLASGLLAADLSGFSDPYVVVHCAGQRRKTRVISQTLEPVWEQTFEIKGNLEDFLSSGVRFEVFDWDELGMDDVLGECKVKLPPELMLQTAPSARDYEERLSPQGRLVFGLTWVPEEVRGVSVVELGAQHAKAKKVDLPPDKECVSIPVLLPTKFDYLTDMWPLSDAQRASQPRSNRLLSDTATPAEIAARAQAERASAAGAKDVQRARRVLNDQSLNRIMSSLTPRPSSAASNSKSKAAALEEKPKKLVLRPSSAHQFARPPSAKIFVVDAFSHRSQRFLDSTRTEGSHGNSWEHLGINESRGRKK